MDESDWERWNCERKDPYRESVAKRIARKMNSTTAFGANVVAYLCRVCKRWHVGKPGKEGRRS